MSERITFQRYAETADGIGGVTQAWSDVVTVWAKAMSASGREGAVNDRTTATNMIVFEMYSRNDLTELDRIVWDGVWYNIRTIKRNGLRPQKMKIEAERGVHS
jgi:SPP1 family predicted phage head-tail adaptor